jgi:uncharacterized protein
MSYRGEFGALLESFVFSEVMKLLTGSDLRVMPHRFRDQQMNEVDLVLERDDGMVVGIVRAAEAKTYYLGAWSLANLGIRFHNET